LSEQVETSPIRKVGDRWCASVDLKDGSPVQNFYGDTQQDVIQKLVEAQANATRKIREQKRLIKTNPQVDPVQKPVEFRAKQLSADDLYRLSMEIAEPTKASQAIRQLIEAELGAPLEAVRSTLQRVTDNDLRAQAKQAADDFLRSHKDYNPTPANEAALLEYLSSHNMGMTAQNLAIAYEDLQDVLDPKIPTPPQVAPEPGRPRAAITSVPVRSNAVGTPTRVKLTAKDIEALSPEQYRQKLTDPIFRAAVDELYASRPRT